MSLNVGEGAITPMIIEPTGSTINYFDYGNSSASHIVFCWKRWEGEYDERGAPYDTTRWSHHQYVIPIDDPDARQALLTILNFSRQVFLDGGIGTTGSVPNMLDVYVNITTGGATNEEDKIWDQYPKE